MRGEANFYPVLTIIALLSAPPIGFADKVVSQTSSQTECKVKVNKKTLPKHLCYKNQKLGFILNHYLLVKDFDSASIVSLSVRYGVGDYSFLSTVTVINSKNQKLVYQVSTDPSRAWNKVWGYYRSVFFKLYEYYPNESYQHPETKNEIHLLKSLSYYSANGTPGKIDGNLFKKEYILKDKIEIMDRLAKLDIAVSRGDTIKNDKNNKRIMEIQYKPNGKVRRKQYISSKHYRLHL